MARANTPVSFLTAKVQSKDRILPLVKLLLEEEEG